MLDLEEDMAAVFYGPDFATTFTRQRPLVADVDVVAIIGVEIGIKIRAQMRREPQPSTRAASMISSGTPLK